MNHITKVVLIYSLAFFMWELSTSSLSAQAIKQPVNIDVLQNPDRFTLMYVADIVQDPAVAPIIFHLRLSPMANNESPAISLEVEFTADVERLGLSNARLFFLRTEPFELSGTLNLTNRLLASRTNILSTEDGQQISIDARNLEFISGSEREELVNALLNAPIFPPGLYVFRYAVYADGELIEENVIPVRFEDVPGLRLLAPADNSIVQTNFPVFQWESTGGSRACEYGIRISEFNPQQHGALEEALNDDAVLPFPDNGDFVRITHENPDNPVQLPTSYQYPLDDGKQLERGKQYVWQVRKYCSSTRGEVTYESEIYTLTIGGDEVDPVRIALRNILGEERFDQLFGIGGELSDFTADQGSIILDGEIISLSQLMRISNSFSAGNNDIIQTTVEE